MRINKFLAQNTQYSRRAGDELISQGRVKINQTVAKLGSEVGDGDKIYLDNEEVANKSSQATTIIIFNKPIGYVCSRNGQGNKTIYDILPNKYHNLNPVGRLDKDSSGLLLLTDNGQLANQLTHPKYQKTKVYEVNLDKPLQPLHQQMISDYGVSLEDGISKFVIIKTGLTNKDYHYQVTMQEGRNRQIRRTFIALGYKVIKLHRTHFGQYTLGNLQPSKSKLTDSSVTDQR